jgi:hypothetical protein
MERNPVTSSNESKEKSDFMLELTAMLRTIVVFFGTMSGFFIVMRFLSSNHIYYICMPDTYSIRLSLVITLSLILISTIFGMFKLIKRKTIIGVLICSFVLSAMMINLLSLLVSWLG